MQKTTCPCGCTYWRKSLTHEKICPSCGGSGEVAPVPCVICGKPLPANFIRQKRKTCSDKCSRAYKTDYERLRVRGQIKCSVCGKKFTPRSCNAKVCPEDYCQAERRRAMQRRRAEGTRAADARKRCAPWGWLRTDVEESGQRQVLDGLAQLGRDANDWPWADVFEGVGPCLIDSMPF